MRKLYFLSFATVFILISCSKDGFLDQTVTTNLDEATVFADSTLTTAFLSDIYTGIGFSSDPGRFSGSGGLQTATDEAEPNITPNITSDIQFITGTINSVTVSSQPWNACYSNIRKVNQLLKHLPSTPLSSKRQLQYEGEARFLRAWYYAILVKHYGGVPIVGDTIYKADDNISAIRNTYEECVNYIVSECENAASVLTLKPSSRNYGRAGAGAALALKSRVLLYAASPLHNGSSFEDPFNNLLGYPNASKERWKLAMDAAEDVIRTGGYQLYVDNTTEPGFGFYAIFNANAGTNDVKASAEQVTVGTIFEKQSGGGAGLEQLFNPPSRNGTGNGGFPYEELVETFAMANGDLINQTGSGYDNENPYINRDPRFYNTIIYDQAILPKGRGVNEPVNIYLGSYNGQPSGQDAVYSGTPTGYYINKFRNRNISGTDAITTSQERPLIRYAEVLLNYAEARNEYEGPDDNVYTALELIRERAGLNPYTLPTGLSQDQMRTIIHHERQVELAFEGHRFWDVRRWMIADETENKTMTGMEITRNGSSVTYKRFNVRKHIFRAAEYFWPIPYDEISKSPELIQNPNY
ncbi:RagB/SusD family nutrient uptake outer membrane protein [Zhouia sp. PK063]|uniref:RagB/SusD family nutrient uptake outer membrane protein n=1 Tax=Zhouia sp. PK063 TaxID=3373602 RepID=UPI00379A4914